MNEHQSSNPEREPAAERPRVWIASLADYNAGRLHGEWIDAAVEGDDLVAAAQRVLASSPEPGAEEWAVFDFDNFGAYRVGEYEDLRTVAMVARGIARFGFAFAAWAEISDVHEDDIETDFEDAFVGYYESQDEFIGSMLDDFGLDDAFAMGVPGWLLPHISIDRAGVLRDLQAAGDMHIEDAPGGGIYVFRL